MGEGRPSALRRFHRPALIRRGSAPPPSPNGRRNRKSAYLDYRRDPNPLIQCDFPRRVASSARPIQRACHTPRCPVAREARSAGDPKRRRERMERDSAGSSIELRAAARSRPSPHHRRRAAAGKMEGRGGYSAGPGMVLAESPARRGRCGKALREPPDASSWKTVRAERQPLPKHIPIRSPGKGPALRHSLPFNRFARSGVPSCPSLRSPHAPRPRPASSPAAVRSRSR